MSGASEKARFYLEQQVPELKEYEKKKIFNKEEILSITKKRSDFEHKLNARGAHPSDFARYAEYEMNLDSLRRKRVKRLGIKAPAHSGQRRIFFILDRATRKFHGDLGLWMQYIEYARKQKAHKKLSQIFTNALRLHPTKAELWIYAAQYALEEHADITQARSYMQRGLRFCKSSKKIWVQYAKLEMIYIAKISARQRILGLDRPHATVATTGGSLDDPDADTVALPKVTGEDINPSLDQDDEVDKVALDNLNSTPALSGAIPIAVFDAAMKHFNDDASLGYDFYNMVVEFDETPCMRRVLNHIAQAMLTATPTSHFAQICNIKVAVAGIQTDSADFPPAFGTALGRLKTNMPDSTQHPKLAQAAVDWLQPLAGQKDIDPALRRVISATLRNAQRGLTQGLTQTSS